MVDSAPKYPTHTFKGRGIVIAGGGVKYLVSAYINVRMLRHVKPPHKTQKQRKRKLFVPYHVPETFNPLLTCTQVLGLRPSDRALDI